MALSETIVAADLGPPYIGLQGAGDHPHRRRLAGAVGTEEREDLAAFDLEVDLVDGEEAAETAFKGAELEQGVEHPSIPLPSAVHCYLILSFTSASLALPAKAGWRSGRSDRVVCP